MREHTLSLTTNATIAGQRIVATIGLVFGLAVRTRGLGGNIMAGLHTLGGNGGELHEYMASLIETRQQALDAMIARAHTLGANAVVTVRFDSAEVGYEMNEIVAYGTAVVVEPTP